MHWCFQTTIHYLDQYWPRSVAPYGVSDINKLGSRLNCSMCIYNEPRNISEPFMISSFPHQRRSLSVTTPVASGTWAITQHWSQPRSLLTPPLRLMIGATTVQSLKSRTRSERSSLGSNMAQYNVLSTTAWIIPWMRPANERWRHSVTPSLIGWVHT